MTDTPPPAAHVPSTGPTGADVRGISAAINEGWIGRGFKLGIGFFLAGLLVWMLPLVLLTTCIGGIAAVGAASALNDHGGLAEVVRAIEDGEEPSGESVTVTEPTAADRAAAATAASQAASDTAGTAAAAGAADTQ